MSSPEGILQQTFYDRELRHNRYLDSITEQSLEEFDECGADLVLREIPVYRKTDPLETDVLLPVNRKKKWEEATDLDLGVIDVDNQVIGAYEVKPSYDEREHAREQLEEFADLLKYLNDEYDMDWTVTGHPVNSEHLNQEYMSPDTYEDGVYGNQSTVRKAFNDEDFQTLVEHLFRGIGGAEVHTRW